MTYQEVIKQGKLVKNLPCLHSIYFYAVPCGLGLFKLYWVCHLMERVKEVDEFDLQIVHIPWTQEEIELEDQRLTDLEDSRN